LLPTVIIFDLVWYRYVDDVFAIIPENIDIQSLLSQINSLSPSINFEIELETNCSLPFLDILINRNNNLPEFQVYRKPTHSDMYIHAFSSHSDSIKLGTISGLFLRAYRICDRKYLDKEIEYLLSTFKKLGYDYHFIDKAHFKARSSFYRPRERRRSEYNNVLVLPSVCNKSTAKKILPADTMIVHSSSSTVKSYLRNKITKGSLRQSGIYKIPCSSCDLQYIGESDDLDRRLQQHKYDIRNNNRNNPIVKHISEAEHPVIIIMLQS